MHRPCREFFRAAGAQGGLGTGWRSNGASSPSSEDVSVPGNDTPLDPRERASFPGAAGVGMAVLMEVFGVAR